jgi:hypothetical protein
MLHATAEMLAIVPIGTGTAPGDLLAVRACGEL